MTLQDFRNSWDKWDLKFEQNEDGALVEWIEMVFKKVLSVIQWHIVHYTLLSLGIVLIIIGLVYLFIKNRQLTILINKEQEDMNRGEGI